MAAIRAAEAAKEIARREQLASRHWESQVRTYSLSSGCGFEAYRGGTR
jgi:hypothetical protein